MRAEQLQSAAPRQRDFVYREFNGITSLPASNGATILFTHGLGRVPFVATTMLCKKIDAVNQAFGYSVGEEIGIDLGVQRPQVATQQPAWHEIITDRTVTVVLNSTAVSVWKADASAFGNTPQQLTWFIKIACWLAPD